MIRIAISQAAFDAIARTLPLGSVAVEAEANERGSVLFGLEGCDGGPARRDAGTGRELQRRDHPLGEGRGMIKKPRLNPLQDEEHTK